MSGKSKSTALTVPSVPSLPTMDIGSDDIVIPRLYIGSSSSKAVQAELATAGSFYVAEKADSEDVEEVLPKGDETGLLVHVLSLVKKLSWTDAQGDLQSSPMGYSGAPEDANVTYNYLVALPEVSGDTVYKWLLTKTGTGAARTINTAIKKAEGQVPGFALAFRVTAKQRTNPKGTWYVPAPRLVDGEQAHVDIAAELALLVASEPKVQAAASDDGAAPSNLDAPAI